MADDETSLILQHLKDLREDFRQERESAHASRAETHKRIDDVVDRIARLDTSQALSGQVDAQVRDELDGFKTRIEAIQPVVDDWVGLIKAGRKVSWIIGISGLLTGGTIIAAFQWFGDSIVTFIRHLLRLQ